MSVTLIFYFLSQCISYQLNLHKETQSFLLLNLFICCFESWKGKEGWCPNSSDIFWFQPVTSKVKIASIIWHDWDKIQFSIWSKCLFLINFFRGSSWSWTYGGMQSVPITTKFVSSNPAHGENLQQVSDLFRVLWFPPHQDQKKEIYKFYATCQINNFVWLSNFYL
jgi:hypothetical protein